MKHLDTTTAPEEFLGAYGPRWTTGLISEHLDLFRRAGGTFRPGAARLGWAVVEGKAFPVVCSELVRIDTEDGPVSGRCGTPATHEQGTCDAHYIDEAELAEEARLSDLDHADYLAHAYA